MASTQYVENCALKYNMFTLCMWVSCVFCSCCWSVQMTFLLLSSARRTQILSLAAARTARCSGLILHPCLWPSVILVVYWAFLLICFRSLYVSNISLKC